MPPHPHRGQRGSTLVAVLVAVVVMGVMAALLVRAYGSPDETVRGARSGGAHVACRADALAVEAAVEAFKVRTGPAGAPGDWPVGRVVVAPGPPPVDPAGYRRYDTAVNPPCQDPTLG